MAKRFMTAQEQAGLAGWTIEERHRSKVPVLAAGLALSVATLIGATAAASYDGEYSHIVFTAQSHYLNLMISPTGQDGSWINTTLDLDKPDEPGKVQLPITLTPSSASPSNSDGTLYPDTVLSYSVWVKAAGDNAATVGFSQSLVASSALGYGDQTTDPDFIKALWFTEDFPAGSSICTHDTTDPVPNCSYTGQLSDMTFPWYGDDVDQQHLIASGAQVLDPGQVKEFTIKVQIGKPGSSSTDPDNAIHINPTWYDGKTADLIWQFSEVGAV
jgi:hypothetical protein